MENSAAAAGSGKSKQYEGKTVEECEDMIRRSLETPKAKFLKESLEKSGCGFGENFIRAIKCDKKISGGYIPREGVIVCSNRIEVQDEVNEVVISGLIHAYDDCKAANKLDWTNCAHHACSRIRAERLSGACNFKSEFWRGYVTSRGDYDERECVRRRVMKALAGNPYCSETASKKAMDAVWDVCYNDTEPFDKAPSDN